MASRLFPIITVTLFVILAISLPGGCGDAGEADALMAESEELRRQATDTLRLQTAVIDAMAATIASGDSLLITRVETSAEDIRSAYDDAAAALEKRGDTLAAASALDLDDAYAEYIRLMQASNEELLAAIGEARAIPDLILADRQALAGWDEERAAEVVAEIVAIEQKMDERYDAAETLRAEAEKLREENPDEFG